MNDGLRISVQDRASVVIFIHDVPVLVRTHSYREKGLFRVSFGKPPCTPKTDQLVCSAVHKVLCMP